MDVIQNVKKEDWSVLTKRPTMDNGTLDDTVRSILSAVKRKKDAALKEFALQFDQVRLESLAVTPDEVKTAISLVSDELKEAINVARENIETFHSSQRIAEAMVETSSGVTCWRRSVAIEKVGLYIPGGSAPLFSTILMLGIPAKIAGCEEVILCTPCNAQGAINPAVLYTAHLIGIDKIYKVGGAQAIGAMAYGTETIPQVYKILGPGNQYVTKAKELVQLAGIAIDMPAGPSEVLVIADETGNPSFIAADLLSQAEHGPDSQVMVLSDNETVLNRTLQALEKQLDDLPRKEVARQALKNSKAVLLSSINECVEFSNQYAPEHLIIASKRARSLADNIKNAGSVFLGNYSCESAGDYASGTNHTLPTNGFARNYSGVSLDSFVKKITFQEVSQQGIKTIGKAIEIMAEAEQLIAHKNAVTIRLKEIEDV
ncbi:MAG: histidinol dehydrogenase [Bacteroidia bacterium]|nr:histidinol dehydrogenase [Bacteroidia bacterium]